MEHHIPCKAEDISRYVFCPGDQGRAKKIAAHFDKMYTVVENRGIVVYSGYYEGVFMTACGTGMGGPVVAICIEELGHMGADTFIRVGSCGVLQEGQKPGDVIIASGTHRGGGTGNAYLPLAFPAVPSYEILRALTDSADHLGLNYRVGIGCASDNFYGSLESELFTILTEAGAVFIEMESDTLFIIGACRGFRTGALFISDGVPGKIKPPSGTDDYHKGEENAIQIALGAMLKIARSDIRKGEK